jgi:hypothetical protein
MDGYNNAWIRNMCKGDEILWNDILYLAAAFNPYLGPTTDDLSWLYGAVVAVVDVAIGIARHGSGIGVCVVVPLSLSDNSCSFCWGGGNCS